MGLSLNQLQRVITAIHATPQKVVIDFAGAGVQALAWLHSVGGSSRTILEATDCYAATSLVEAIGFEPEQFASPDVARAMAIRAYSRAVHLAGPAVPVAGIGCTATIATDRPKRGSHRACVAVCEAHGLTTYTLTLVKGRRSRSEEEELVSLLLLKAVANAGKVDGLPELELVEPETLVEDYEPVDWLARLLAGEVAWLAIAPDGRMKPGYTWPKIAFLSGAFNPLHQGHRQLVQVASDILEREVYFELPLVNADKAPLDVEEARCRIEQFAGWATVILTRVPLFNQKAEIFPQSVFVLGIDTVQRLWEPRFYYHDPVEMYVAFKMVQEAGCRFLVAGRLQGENFLTLQDVNIPAGYRHLFKQIPPHKFRVDISSTAIRREQA
ncbi:MAG: hypothetical protein JXM69_03260 [Anaerolineae bacterium]|nr:hypothetical protein [Anaerolineae bacterium]